MGFDTSTLRRHVSVSHTVDTEGNPVDLVESTHARYGCIAHAIGWNSWEDAREHCQRFHGEEASGENHGAADELPSDSTQTSENVSVGLEPPASEEAPGEAPEA